jgi:hypothetical protein
VGAVGERHAVEEEEFFVGSCHAGMKTGFATEENGFRRASVPA